MTVADAALPSPPTTPPSVWIVGVALALVRLALTPMLVLVRFALTPMLVLVRVLCVPAGALACLFFATAWVTSAASAAQVVAGRAWGEGSAPFLFLQELIYGAFKLCVYSSLFSSHLPSCCFSFVPRPNSVDGAVPSKLEAAKKHHHLNLNTLGGHTDCITVLDFFSDACNLATGDPLLKAIRGDTFLQPSKMTYPY
ncbi:hypothetical protein ZWY2020_005332 [Hordeum vulgare]|nr:hypothetical protein ZWY2020_005332 [Hordeum vulgare]